MVDSFKAEVFQNQYLSKGSDEVHAIMTVTAMGNETTQVQTSVAGGRLFGIICDISGSMEGEKLVSAKGAMIQLIHLLPSDCAFFVVLGEAEATTAFPLALATQDAKVRAITRIRDVKAAGATFISKWLTAALEQFRFAPNALKQAVLLTDGQNDKQDEKQLQRALTNCEGVFQCDCRGVGTDWNVQELRHISNALLGNTDIIMRADQIKADFEQILGKAMSKTAGDVMLRLWTPVGADIQFCKEVSPQIRDLSNRFRQVKPQIREYPTGSWARNEVRDFHFAIKVKPGEVGDEVLAGRASLVYTIDGAEQKAAEARILAIWTDDEAKSAKIDNVVAHYTGQSELAESIRQGLEARARGDKEQATALLGKAVQVAHQTGNDATEKLLRNVVDVQDADTGTVRLKSQVAKEDEMALDTRSTKTTRLPKN
jgi:hypothetical protein